MARKVLHEGWVWFFLPILVAVLLAINMGASGTAPSFAAPYGANLLRRDSIPGLFGMFVMLGAVVAGYKVSRTLGGEILPASAMSVAVTSIVLLAVCVSLSLANLMGIPQSTSQSTVLALVGSATYLGRLETGKLLLLILPTWFLLPLVAFLTTYLFARYCYDPVMRLRSISFNRSSPLWMYLTIGSSCYVAFSIGSNNVANAAGPLASALANGLHLDAREPVYWLIPLLTSVFIAPWFGIGSSLLGHRVLETAAKQITSFGPLGASFISLLTGTLLLLASLTQGIPTSLVQLNTATILAIGIVKGGLRKTATETSVPRIFLVWAIAPLVAFLCAFGLTALAAEAGWLNWDPR